MSHTPVELLFDLKKIIIEATENMSLGDKKEPPGVHVGYLPKKKAPMPHSPVDPAVPVVIKGVTKNNQTLAPESDDDDEYYPFVIIRATEITDEEYDSDSQAQAAVPVNFLLGTKSRDEDGYRDVMHLAQVIRQTLLESGIVGAAAELQRPVRTIFYEEQPYPQWNAEIKTNWSLPTPQRKVDFINGYSRRR